jgi:hypothetical protein
MRKGVRKYVLAFHRWDGEVALLEKKQPFSFDGPDVEESFITYEEHGFRELAEKKPFLSILLGAEVVASESKARGNNPPKTMKRLVGTDAEVKVINWESEKKN